MSDLDVTITTIKDDAKRWDHAAEDFANPHQLAESLRLQGAKDVTGSGARVGIDTAYEKFRETFGSTVDKAQGCFQHISEKLDGVAKNYYKSEHERSATFDAMRQNLEK